MISKDNIDLRLSICKRLEAIAPYKIFWGDIELLIEIHFSVALATLFLHQYSREKAVSSQKL
jgi:hypothetical protein